MAAKTVGRLAASLAVACSVAACSNGGARTDLSQMGHDLNSRFPISAQPKEAVLVLDNMTERSIAHDPGASARVGAFVYDFANRSSSNMQILVGAGTVDDATAKEIARGAVRVLSKQGVPTSRMDVRVVSGNNHLRPGTVVMRYTQWVANQPECPGYGGNIAVDYSGGATPNLGCSIQRNIAAMVADPRDLAQPSPMEMREGMPGEAVMRKFRAGEKTSTFEWVKVEIE